MSISNQMTRHSADTKDHHSFAPVCKTQNWVSVSWQVESKVHPPPIFVSMGQWLCGSPDPWLATDGWLHNVSGGTLMPASNELANGTP